MYIVKTNLKTFVGGPCPPWPYARSAPASLVTLFISVEMSFTRVDFIFFCWNFMWIYEDPQLYDYKNSNNDVGNLYNIKLFLFPTFPEIFCILEDNFYLFFLLNKDNVKHIVLYDFWKHTSIEIMSENETRLFQ